MQICLFTQQEKQFEESGDKITDDEKASVESATVKLEEALNKIVLSLLRLPLKNLMRY